MPRSLAVFVARSAVTASADCPRRRRWTSSAAERIVVDRLTGGSIDVSNGYMKFKPPDQYHHGGLRLALIEAAARVAATEGVGAIGMRALARSAGVSSGAPFRHFQNSAALLVAVAEEGANRQLQAMQAAVIPTATPLEQQRQMGVAYVRWCVAEPGFFRVMSRAESLAGSPRLQAQQADFVAGLEAALVQSAGTASHDALPAEMVQSIGARALVYGLARMAVDGLLGPELSPDDAACIADHITRALSFHFAPEAP